MFTSKTAKTVKTLSSFLAVSILATVSFLVLTNSTPAVSADSGVCSAKGDVTDSSDGLGIIFTVTTTGLCSDTPLVLTSIDADGNSKVLASLALKSNSDGGKVASVSFVPLKSVKSYVVNVENAFTATVNP